jgi:hypothetical protein
MKWNTGKHLTMREWIAILQEMEESLFQEGLTEDGEAFLEFCSSIPNSIRCVWVGYILVWHMCQNSMLSNPKTLKNPIFRCCCGSPPAASNISTIACLELDGDSNDTEGYTGSGLNNPTSCVFRCIRVQVCRRGYKLVKRGSQVPSPVCVRTCTHENVSACGLGGCSFVSSSSFTTIHSPLL